MELRLTKSLTLTSLWASSADDKLIIFFIIFPIKQDLTFRANCLYFNILSAENFTQY